MKLLRDPYVVVIAAIILVVVPICLLVAVELNSATSQAVVAEVMR